MSSPPSAPPAGHEPAHPLPAPALFRPGRQHRHPQPRHGGGAGRARPRRHPRLRPLCGGRDRPRRPVPPWPASRPPGRLRAGGIRHSLRQRHGPRGAQPRLPALRRAHRAARRLGPLRPGHRLLHPAHRGAAGARCACPARHPLPVRDPRPLARTAPRARRRAAPRAGGDGPPADAACRRAAAVVALSGGMAEAAIARGAAPGGVHVVPNGCDLHAFGPHIPRPGGRRRRHRGNASPSMPGPMAAPTGCICCSTPRRGCAGTGCACCWSAKAARSPL